MKNILFLMLGIAAMLASCSQSEDLAAENDSAQQVTFSLTAGSGAQTRATGTLRYVMAIYDETAENEVVPETVYGSSSFAVRLDPGKYTCLFWADYGEANYNAADLKSVALLDAATNAEAFYARQGITVTDGGTVSVTLSRAVAQVILRETDFLEAGSMTVSYSGFRRFDVCAGSASDASAATLVLPIASAIRGSVSSPAEIGSFLMLANPGERNLNDFKVKYADEAEKAISNVPVQANHRTYINGKFGESVNQQFSIGIDDAWADPDKTVNLEPYVTFSAASEQTFTMYVAPGILGTNEYFEYAVGDGSWTRFTTVAGGVAFGGALGDLRLRGKSSQGTAMNEFTYSIIYFGTAGILVECTGDIRTLIDYANYETVNTADARFCRLFGGNSLLKTAPALPATALAEYCYQAMFQNCTSLTTAPELPATALAESCYQAMFQNCTSLTIAPELPATALVNSCYSGMFAGCTSLTTAPALPATALAESCYSSMFWGCTSLTTAPVLPATALAERCYSSMFWDCTSLTTAPTLPATALANYCYSDMFGSCTSLTTAPELPATALAESCYSSMFWGCTSLTTAPVLSATALATKCYSDMFDGCTSLTTSPELPATALAAGCYGDMFRGCTSLTAAPALPATALANNCYSYMFIDCTSLTTAPELTATVLANNCYQSMFYGCTSLTTAPELPATALAESCYNSMFQNCTSLSTAPELTATALADGCYGSMFKGCTKLSEVKMLATDISYTGCLDDWLTNAGTGEEVSSRILTLYNRTTYDALAANSSYLPANWKEDQATIRFTNP